MTIENSVKQRLKQCLLHLSEIQRHVTQHQGTEAPFSGKLLNNKCTGVYHCICCEQALFLSASKFDSGSGWPSFTQSIVGSLCYLDDYQNNTHRIEIRCSYCNAHLGHQFDDGPPPTGRRYCVNSAALKFIDTQSGERVCG